MTTEEGNREIVMEEKKHYREVEIQRNSSEATAELRAVSQIITSTQALASR